MIVVFKSVSPRDLLPTMLSELIRPETLSFPLGIKIDQWYTEELISDHVTVFRMRQVLKSSLARVEHFFIFLLGVYLVALK